MGDGPAPQSPGALSHSDLDVAKVTFASTVLQTELENSGTDAAGPWKGGGAIQ